MAVDEPAPAAVGPGDPARPPKRAKRQSYAQRKRVRSFRGLFCATAAPSRRRFLSATFCLTHSRPLSHSHQQKLQVEELEAKLFGPATDDPTSGFGLELGGGGGRDGSDGDGNAPPPPLLFFEDRDGGDEAGAIGERAGDAPSPRRPRTRAAAAAAGGGEEAAAAAAGATAPPTPAAAPTTTPPAAWHDPYTDAATVDVAAGPARLRKLRAHEDETVLGGGDYEARLRARFAATHQHTGWAAAARKAAARAAKAAAAAAPRAADAPASGEALLASGAALLARPASAGGAAATTTTTSAPLSPGRLEITRLPDANAAAPADAVIQAVAFHPGGQVLLTAGFDKAVRFFQADGLAGAHLQTVHLRDCPVHAAAFARGGDAVVATGRRPFFYVLDLATGRAHRVGPLPGRPEKSWERFAAADHAPGADLLALVGDRGSVPLFSLRTRSPVGELRHAGTVRTAAFDPADTAGHTLLTAGGDGVLHTWDLRATRACVRRDVDEGSLSVTALAPSVTGALATGSTSGVVNVYRRGPDGGLGGGGGSVVGGWAGAGAAHAASTSPATPSTPQPAARPAPARALMNLATSIDTLAWAPSGAVLAAGSRLAADGLRLVHGGSLTVFPNWPTSRTPLGHVHCAAFSPGGGLLAAGTAKGRVLAYRLHDLPI
jgi:U3 small nucleolar RNA-associated protein 18